MGENQPHFLFNLYVFIQIMGNMIFKYFNNDHKTSQNVCISTIWKTSSLNGSGNWLKIIYSASC